MAKIGECALDPVIAPNGMDGKDFDSAPGVSGGKVDIGCYESKQEEST